MWLAVETGSGVGFWQGTFIGAFLLLSASRLFAQVSRLPAAIILLPAVMPFAPGVTALRALYVGHTLGLVGGLRSMSEVTALIATIPGGLLLGEAVWSIRRVAISAVTSRRSHRESGHG